KMCVIDVRHSNTASKADWWLAPWPGTEPMLLLAIAKQILDQGLYNREFLEKWVNWEEALAHMRDPGRDERQKTRDPGGTGSLVSRSFVSPMAEAQLPPSEGSFEAFIAALREHYAFATPEAAAEECGVDAEAIRAIAKEIGKAGSALATHVWRNAAAGNYGGWQVSRSLEFLVVLMGAVGARGGTNLNTDNKFVPPTFLKPPPQKVWNELLYPREYPLAYHEPSYLLPHFLEEGRGKVAAYFTRVYNPVWTNPDGLLWERVLKDESKIELHAALTPVWSETAQYADYVLPMGNGAERYDLMSQETHAAKWIGFRQPVQRVARERNGERFQFTYEANPGEVWDETEFWIELSWRIDPDGSLGVRKYFESPYRPGEKIGIQEYYRWIFENAVPGLPEAAAEKNLTPFDYMSRYGAFLVKDEAYGTFGTSGTGGTEPPGFKTPSKKLELFSQTMADWGWPEDTMPGYIKSHVHRGEMKSGEFEFVLVPTFRLPTLIHTRSANAKWLYELSNSNPVWIHPTDAEKLGLSTGDLVKIATRIGYYVNRVWVTESMRPGIVACSHHLGRWRLTEDGTDKMASVKVVREETAPGVIRFRRAEDIAPYASPDSDTKRIWWTDGGVHQNLTFPVQPDPISGQHCWHQRVVVSKAGPEDRYGDVFVDTNKSMEVYREWLAKTKPAPGPGGLRRPLWFDRALRPDDEAYRLPT
ncbi:MAG TPA: molybdopterin dinucleotide binding domain-containing protein, partial [Fimbriimonadaceae bacterium]|nr:molybdopterin dinucleotide binding domain-containing protein [Fimbriimonadaceae bacterium]